MRLPGGSRACRVRRRRAAARVFDNATEVGRRVGAQISTSALFRRFAAHYGLDYSFTNPYSGNEKGLRGEQGGGAQAEPLRADAADMGREGVQRAAARRLPALSEGKSRLPQRASQVRALRGRPRGALAAPLGAVRVRQVDARKCDRQGSFKAGGEHRFRGPGQRLARVAVAMGAFDVTVVGPGGEVVAEYARRWGEAPTDSADPCSS